MMILQLGHRQRPRCNNRLTELRRLAAFVRDHSMECHIEDDAVAVYIPVTFADGRHRRCDAYAEIILVRSIGEALNALGY